jgi:ribosomal protein S18 acetylase RimI-like enzyme
MDTHRATLADLATVAPMFDSYRQFYGLASDPALARSFIADRLQHNDSVIFLATEWHQAIGFVQLYPVFSSTAARPGRLWLLNDLYVTPEGRSQGVGRALMERARGHAIETGATGLFLQTARNNSSAQRLYESLGYRLDEQFLVYELTLP